MKYKKYPVFLQPDTKDCGPSCLKMIAKFYGKVFSIVKLREICETTREGSNMKFLSIAAEKIGLKSLGVKINFYTLKTEVEFPCLVHWGDNHFIVVYEINSKSVIVGDPVIGIVKHSHNEFLKSWVGKEDDSVEGPVLLIEPTLKFYQHDELDSDKKSISNFISKYVVRYKKYIFQLLLALFTGSVLQLLFPFLFQSIVDIGIENNDINFIYLILLGQIFLFIGSKSIELIRGWLLLHLSTKINISLVSDFFIKLMSLPISFFDVKMTGDILQRINDHSRIESFLTSSSLTALFSFFNIIIYGIVLLLYNTTIFFVFFLCSVIYIGWILVFLNKRKSLDYKRFSQLGDEQGKVIELINGMQEIKLHNAEKVKRWQWEKLKVKIFRVEVKSLTLEQVQTVGAGFIQEIQNILITVLSAKLVIEGEITLGMMLSISYIMGQLNSPVQQLIEFVLSLQDAAISVERLLEIHQKEEEFDIKSVTKFPENEDIFIKDLKFRYKGTLNFVLDDINLLIPRGKITAIVGASGSGKTTLIKLLLKFYAPQSGIISVGSQDIKYIAQDVWREKVGTVMQEGYIFDDTIENNIAVGNEGDLNLEQLRFSSHIANIEEFINTLPRGYKTEIGTTGLGLSTGQKQRILIARAIYKNPDILFFDEATSALDAKSERIVMNNLNEYFKSKTAIVIAHRLSTVKNADQIIVLDQGRVVEQGNHQKLISQRGKYFELIKNQLELGN